MVGFLPPPLARLATLTLLARNQEGMPPATSGLTSRSLGATPADPFAVAGGPTSYRMTQRAAGKMAPKEKYKYGVRTAEDESVPPDQALNRLKEGNKRFVSGNAEVLKNWDSKKTGALASYGQNPMAAVLGCADSRAPVELLFDALPGDVFVLRNAGNTLTNAEGSMVGSLEFCVNALGAKLVVVLGHTSCGAIKGATATLLEAQKEGKKVAQSSLDRLLIGLSPVVEQAQLDLKGSDSADDIANEAVEVNVFAGIHKLLLYSESIREKVKSGEVEVHGAVYDIASGEVKFLGQHPRLPLILGMQAAYKAN